MKSHIQKTQLDIKKSRRKYVLTLMNNTHLPTEISKLVLSYLSSYSFYHTDEHKIYQTELWKVDELTG